MTKKKELNHEDFLVWTSFMGSHPEGRVWGVLLQKKNEWTSLADIKRLSKTEGIDKHLNILYKYGVVKRIDIDESKKPQDKVAYRLNIANPVGENTDILYCHLLEIRDKKNGVQ